MEHEQLLEFIPAEKLKETFEVFGHFYSIDLKSGDRIDCRSVLEIVTKKSKPSDTDLLLEQVPDAIFVMMNPGSSKPHEEVNNIVSDGRVCFSPVLSFNVNSSIGRTLPLLIECL